MTAAQRLAHNDYLASLAIADAAKRERVAARARCMANAELEAILREQAHRRGEIFAWDAYFQSNGF